MSSSTSISDAEFRRLAFPELRRLVEAVDALGDGCFAELAGDVLTVEFADSTRCIINTQAPTRQIWMAADRTAWHFDYSPEAGWVDAKSGQELWSTLGALLSRKLGGRPLSWNQPRPA